MELELIRFCDQPKLTIGALYIAPRLFQCFTLEDQHQEMKVPGETRIPAGRYRIKLRTAGQMHIEYGIRFRDIHKGVLHLQDVPGFEWIYLHTGNTPADTRGCILLGDSAFPRAGQITGSEVAYRRIYLLLAAHLIAKGEVWITVKDFA